MESAQHDDFARFLPSERDLAGIFFVFFCMELLFSRAKCIVWRAASRSEVGYERRAANEKRREEDGPAAL